MVEKVIPTHTKKIWVLLGGEKCLRGNCKMWAALNCWAQAKQRHKCLIQDEKEEISKVILSWMNSMDRWFIQVINTVGSWLLSSHTDRMWFDSKSQIGTFSGNLSMPQIKHLKNSLHTYWLWCYSEDRERTTGKPAYLNAVLIRKGNRLVSVCVILKFVTVKEGHTRHSSTSEKQSTKIQRKTRCDPMCRTLKQNMTRRGWKARNGSEFIVRGCMRKTRNKHLRRPKSICRGSSLVYHLISCAEKSRRKPCPKRHNSTEWHLVEWTSMLVPPGWQVLLWGLVGV